MIRCGNCKGRHKTVADVMACHEGKLNGSPVAVGGATPKQIAYAESLLEQRQAPDDYTAPDLNTLTKEQASTLIDMLLRLPKKAKETVKRDFNQWLVVEGSPPKPGTYTVEHKKFHRTFRFRKPHPNADWVAAEYLFGSDNSRDFRKFGKVVENGVAIWNGSRTDAPLIEALKFLLNLDSEALAEAGFKYALESGNCYRCGRTLTVPASIHRGMGPVCAAKEE